jgi:hypothetical protein
MIIAIPTYKRPNKLLTLELANNIVGAENVYIIFHTNEDYLEYSKNYQIKNKIITNLTGITKQRNAILNHFPVGTEIIMMDDDVTEIYILENNKLRSLTPFEIFKQFTNNFNICKKNNCFIWGIYPVKNAYFMKKRINNKGFIIGCCFGIINNELRYDENLTSKEDYDITLQNIKKYNKVARFDYLTTNAKHYQKGGCEEIWKTNKKRLDVEYLIKKWGKLIKLNKKRDNEILI